jgi:hypothetical protein
MPALDLKFIDGRNWELIRPYRYVGQRWKGVVPRHFITDFASVPQIFWNILPPTGPYGPAAVVHDFLYRTAAVTRADADWTFREAMELLGVGWWVRQTMYSAVRTFGAPAYHRPAPKPPVSS